MDTKVQVETETSTQTLDTVEGQDTSLRPHGKHNDNFVDAPHSPTPLR